MNDFTKEELEELKSSVHWKISAGPENSLTRPLISKIQSMIDNYCEHEMVETEISYTNYVCNKCGLLT